MKKIWYLIFGYFLLIGGILVLIGNFYFFEESEIRDYSKSIIAIITSFYLIFNAKKLAGRKDKLNSYDEYKRKKENLSSNEKIKILTSVIETDHSILTYQLAEQNKEIYTELSSFLNASDKETLNLISEKYDIQFEKSAQKENSKNHQKLKKYVLNFKLKEMLNIEAELEKILRNLEHKVEKHE